MLRIVPAVSHAPFVAVSRALFVAVSLASFVVALLFAAAPVGAQTAGFSLRASPSAVAPGEPVTISVYLENADPAVNITGAQIGLSFDTVPYTLTDFETPDMLGQGAVTDFFAFNGPPPIGIGGTTGCTYWWDDVDLDTERFRLREANVLAPGGIGIDHDARLMRTLDLLGQIDHKKSIR